MSSTVLSNESALYVAPGGPVYRFMRRLALDRHGQVSVLRRIILLISITWLPMCIFAILQGFALGATPRESFLLDFAAYARYFIALPLMIFADGIIGPRRRLAGLQFVRDGLVGPQDMPAFEQAVARLASRRESVTATVVTIALALFGAWQLTFESATGVANVASWQTFNLPGNHALSYPLAALWSHLVALPVFLFFLYRWLWRLIFWTLFLFDVSRIELRLVPTHADGAGGLGFLEIAHVSFGTLAFAATSVLSAQAAFRIVYEGAGLKTFQGPVIIVFLVILVLFLGPLLLFSPMMNRTWRAAMRSYGSLVVHYNRGFHEKWVDKSGPPGEPLLGSADIQSLADLGNSFRFVNDMKIVPLSRWAFIYLALATVLPGLPLVLLVVPVSEIIDALAKVAL